ncbi:MAG: glycosyltransferase family 1 protein, partial [Thermodesulfobacteriota bacterium]|nr:glycosyltransferase family 1 protein [Thermodesulfobacteriota bacterium]
MSGPYRILYVENGIGYGGATICLRHLVRNLDRSTYIPMVVTSLNDQEFREIASDAPWKYIPDKLINVSKMRRAMDRSRWSKHIPVLRFFINQLISRVDDFCNFLPFFIRFLLLSICFRPALIHANNEPM